MDKIYKGLIFNDEISVFLADTTEMVNRAINYHKLSPLTAAALGRSLTACTFMCTTLKNDGDKLSVTINGDGVGGNIVVCGNSDLKIRGTIDNPEVELPPNSIGKLDVAGCVGHSGRMTVVKNLGLKEPYVGTCELVSGEIAEDFSAYYTYSEQQPTGMALGVRIGKDKTCVGAGGLVLQPLPFASEESIRKAEELLSHFYNISSMIEETGIENIKDKYLKDAKLTELNAEYKCLCSKEYIDGVIVSLGKAETAKIVEEEGKIEVCCHFCDKKYTYYGKDLDELFKEKDKGQNG